jgi:hypothetical protein
MSKRLSILASIFLFCAIIISIGFTQGAPRQSPSRQGLTQQDVNAIKNHRTQMEQDLTKLAIQEGRDSMLGRKLDTHLKRNFGFTDTFIRYAERNLEIQRKLRQMKQREQQQMQRQYQAQTRERNRQQYQQNLQTRQQQHQQRETMLDQRRQQAQINKMNSLMQLDSYLRTRTPSSQMPGQMTPRQQDQQLKDTMKQIEQLPKAGEGIESKEQPK